MKKIEKDIQCKACEGTGLYVGVCERDGAAVICRECNGTGKYRYVFEYGEFTGRKRKEGVTRVYRDGYGYVISPGKVNFKGIGMVDMDKEGVSYEEFEKGTMPGHIKKLACPLLADQCACYSIPGFVKECERLHGGYIGRIDNCSYWDNRDECWKRFDASVRNRENE